MPNGGFDPEAKNAQFGERVDKQSRQISDLDTRISKVSRDRISDPSLGRRHPWQIENSVAIIAADQGSVVQISEDARI